MPFCPKCGNEYQPGTKFCGKCGQTLDSATGTPAPAPAPTPAVTPKPANTQPGFFQKLIETKDSTSEMDASDINNNKILAILAYSALYLFVILNWFISGFYTLLITAGLLVAPAIMAAKSKFLKVHVGQVMTALFGIIIVEIVESQIASWIYWGVYSGGTPMRIVGTILAWFVHLIFMAIPLFIITSGMLNAISGKARRLPIIGKFNFTTSD